ncbi:sensor histidine kinase [Streptomyces sp. IB201691-2A2]|uniref:sensor histidine kinase n=1 Tax=Streptomyces sp. IB201691-2A2 TaxID=2561920 RepID=UPI00117D06D1|nr:sensor histidine kinase [Streptomyces sp. IB201691-2A2]TRO62507.1 sensor histidine kinase [Streptomyces sp. IB201691-2A2]
MTTSRQRLVCRPVRGLVRDSPRARDISIALLLFAVSVPGALYVSTGTASPLPWWAVLLLSGVSCAVLPLHRTRPYVTVAVTTACAVTAAGLGQLQTVLSLGPLMAALYSFALRTDRDGVRRCCAIGVAVLLMTTELIAGPADRPLDLKAVGPAAWVLLPTALGSWVRLRRAYVDAVRARAEHAERTRDEEARRRVAEERMRIARELHDVTAQHLALANAQAGAITHLMRSDPDRAHGILADFAVSTSSALRELKATVGLLRQTDDDPDAPVVPAVGLARLAALTESFRSAGLAVTVTTEGAPHRLSPGADHTAFRIVQEALTNVTKHAAAREARVRLAHSDDRLTITVTDDGGGPTPSRATGDSDTGTGTGTGSGFGLLGMRERAQSVGGSLLARHRPEGGFEVVAELPLFQRDFGQEEAGGSTPVRSP